MSLIAELKRRKVFKVGAAYLVVAWLVVQVGATVAPQLGLPEWAPRLVTLLVLLGFPISLVVAWMVDVTPEGIRLESRAGGQQALLRHRRGARRACGGLVPARRRAGRRSGSESPRKHRWARNRPRCCPSSTCPPTRTTSTFPTA